MFGLIIVIYPLAHILSFVSKPGCKKNCCTSTHCNVVQGIVNEVMVIIAAINSFIYHFTKSVITVLFIQKVFFIFVLRSYQLG